MCLLTFILGFGAMMLVRRETIEGVEKVGNMAVPLLAQEPGGGVFLGFIAAVSFATILAVVAGLALAGAAALSHDLWVNAVRKGEVPERAAPRGPNRDRAHGRDGDRAGHSAGSAERRLHGRARGRGQRQLPALLMSICWRRFTTWGAVASIAAGTVSALLLIYLSPTTQVDVLGNDDAPLSLKNPALISMPLAFVLGIVVSSLTPEPESEERYLAAERQIHLGPSRRPPPSPRPR